MKIDTKRTMSVFSFLIISILFTSCFEGTTDKNMNDIKNESENTTSSEQTLDEFPDEVYGFNGEVLRSSEAQLSDDGSLIFDLGYVLVPGDVFSDSVKDPDLFDLETKTFKNENSENAGSTYRKLQKGDVVDGLTVADAWYVVAKTSDPLIKYCSATGVKLSGEIKLKGVLKLVDQPSDGISQNELVFQPLNEKFIFVNPAFNAENGLPNVLDKSSFENFIPHFPQELWYSELKYAVHQCQSDEWDLTRFKEMVDINLIFENAPVDDGHKEALVEITIKDPSVFSGEGISDKYGFELTGVNKIG